jgi:UDP-glucose 4-epimerase
MKIIILGSEGFIGSNLCRFFLENNHTVYGADVLENPPAAKYNYIKVSRLSSQWEDLLQTANFDICINAAGSGNVSYSVNHPLIDFEANTLDVIRILDAIRKYRPACKYLHISSAAVYGNPAQLPVKETHALQPISPYGYHKMMSEILCREYHNLFKVSLIVIRPFSLFGNGLKKQLLWDISMKLTKADTINLFGTGNETRDFIHISDFVLLVEKLIHSAKFEAEVYNVASGTETSIKDIAAIFKNNYGTSPSIAFNGETKTGDPVNWQADVSAIKQLGFKPKADFETEVINYIKWFKQINANG